MQYYKVLGSSQHQENGVWTKAKPMSGAHENKTRASIHTGMHNKLFFVLACVVFVCYTLNTTEAAPKCSGAPEGGWPEPPVGMCPHGTTSDYCGRKVCAKGPGDVCGTGLFRMLGTCGDGMYCNCGRCIGCSLNTMECYDKTCT